MWVPCASSDPFFLNHAWAPPRPRNQAATSMAHCLASRVLLLPNARVEDREIRGSLDLAAPLTPGSPLDRCSPPLILIPSEHMNWGCCDFFPRSSSRCTPPPTKSGQARKPRLQPHKCGPCYQDTHTRIHPLGSILQAAPSAFFVCRSDEPHCAERL